MQLLICLTPLQSLIARQIIVKVREKDAQAAFTLLYLTYFDNAKHQHYYNELAKICEQSAYVVLDNTTIAGRLATFSRLKAQLQRLALWRQTVDTLYLASIDVIFIQYVMSRLEFKQLVTFDDGTANIFSQSSYYFAKLSVLKRLFKQAVRIRYPTIESVKARSQRHYTIFADEKNIIEPTIPLSLFPDQSASTIDKPYIAQPITVKRLLLGQALDKFIGAEAYIDLVNMITNRYHIDAFCPHPGEKIDFSEVLPVVKSDYIIEDYLLQQLQANPETSYEIYTFMSTAVFSLRAFPRVTIVILYNQDLMARFADGYQLLAEHGFKLVDLDKIGDDA